LQYPTVTALQQTALEELDYLFHPAESPVVQINFKNKMAIRKPMVYKSVSEQNYLADL